jgi:hypothetical protein
VKGKWLILGAGLLLALSLPDNCRASLLYGIEFSTGTGFYSVNQNTGLVSLIGNTGNTSTGDLTSDLSSTIWTVDLTTAALLSINPSTGAVSGAKPITSASGAPITIVSLAWNPITQILYGNTAVGFGNTLNDQLYQINPSTGAATLIGTIGFNSVFALGFSNAGILYGISDTSSQLVTINLASGSGSLVGPVSLTSAFDLAFRPEDNVMFVANSATSSLYTMNPATGASTLVGPYGGTPNVVGLAFLGVPEPETIGLILIGISLLCGRLRKV